MTEEEWSEACAPYSMFALIRRPENARKMQLFGCGCCRQVWRLLVDERSREALLKLEAEADDARQGWGDFDANNLANQARHQHHAHTDGTLDAAEAVFDVAPSNPLEFLFGNLEDAFRKSCGMSKPQFQRLVCDLLRDIFGNPFRPVTLDARLQTETVVALATSIYTDCAFDRIPILADALEEAGCDNADVLNHCRGEGPHVRGCWVVDLLLGKS